MNRRGLEILRRKAELSGVGSFQYNITNFVAGLILLVYMHM
jgi:hypothetical protein